MRLTALLLLLFIKNHEAATSGVVNLRAKQNVNSVGTGDRFGGIGTSSDESDHFKLLAADGESLLVGARNAVYNLSLSTLSVNHMSNVFRTSTNTQMTGKSTKFVLFSDKLLVIAEPQRHSSNLVIQLK
uniref:LAM_G_DOMAIN domain-containing protein n=1 Tax=Caenorhabditis tropicalis TaxID=1561998 RepID=A0A1I7TAM1_9PELO